VPPLERVVNKSLPVQAIKKNIPILSGLFGEILGEGETSTL
jgi:hypothetical protein